MGDSFVEADHAAFSSKINAAPYLHTVPPDLCVFSNLLKTFGVRSSFQSSDFCGVLKRMYDEQQSNKESTSDDSANVNIKANANVALRDAAAATDLAVNLALLLSDDVMHLSDLELYCPDIVRSLHPTSDLVFDDAPWLSKTLDRQDLVFVHPKVSADVGEKLGVRSLRRLLVNLNSESLDFGVPHEAFGQQESLTRRLRSIIEMYPEGPSILSELIQNADDSGATTVKVMVSKRKHGNSSLLGPKMRAFQGPSIYVYNDSVFSDRDMSNLSRIGQASKLDKLYTTGRFGLGFNSVFHWTDVPSFVTGDHLVMFDPHERYVPGATSTSRGIKIKFPGSGLIDQFPDQFGPYCRFGCDMKGRFNGTLFRFPLRDAQTASDSEISKTSYDEDSIEELLSTFQQAVPRFLLFLRNVKRVEVYMEDEEDVDDAPPRMLYFADVTSREPLPPSPKSSILSRPTESNNKWSEIAEYIQGPPDRPLSKDAFYSKLTQTPASALPSTQHMVTIEYSDMKSSSTVTIDEYLICTALGGGRCRKMACDEQFRHMKFLPWGGVAAHLLRNSEVAPTTVGNAFCFLPLPVETGLPIHINGYFELSSNRRDIWIGQDMTGEGRIRSEWNELLLSDVIGPLYVDLLMHVSTIIGSGQRYFNFWPTKENQIPWRIVSASLYGCAQDKPLFYSENQQGEEWKPSSECIFVEEAIEDPHNLRESKQKKEQSSKLTTILRLELLPVVVLPVALVTALKSNGDGITSASPLFVRKHYKKLEWHLSLEGSSKQPSLGFE
jgi:sacsin